VAPLGRLTNGGSVSPSALAKKILCRAYVPKAFDAPDRLRFLGLHALTVIKVLSRHLAMGYSLKSLERGGAGFRVDLLLEDSVGRTRLIEVKSSKRIRETHRLQAALYHMVRPDVSEIVVSNGYVDEVLGTEYVLQAIEKAQSTIKLLESDPATAASSFSPHEDTCYICGNNACPYLPLAKTVIPFVNS